MDTIKIRKANTILTVAAEDKSSYLAKGYDVLGEDGSVLEESTPTDTATLQAKYLELKEENLKLKKELDALKRSKSKVQEQVVKEDPVDEVQVKKTARRKTQK